MSKLSASVGLSIILGSIILIPNYTGLVEGQLAEPVTNVSNLTSSDGLPNVVLENKTIQYFDDAQGYLVYPVSTNDSQRKLPAVVMIHEWWGLNQNIKDMANLLAKNGFVVLAADLYHGKVTDNPQLAMELVQTARDNQNSSTANLQAAVKYLSSAPNVDNKKIVSLGWCFGGGQSLQLALNSQEHPLAATILYYGTPLVTDNESISKIKWPVLGIFGDKDEAIPIAEINQFRSSLNESGIKNEIHVYSGVGHAFANPSGDSYAPEETADAWQRTLSFLKKYVSET
ncbi:MAG: dienelactone hydrolase family protein [Nitrososphaeraceae archaeon]|jgi:carboxymethylenebutenolidase|nr:dienelactone hydrolase family protein [Nitrososphaeraceae archaeon]